MGKVYEEKVLFIIVLVAAMIVILPLIVFAGTKNNICK